jgi:ABC-type bacteriocin/lantibiotic exporter with double-glycine peptidase domain
MSAQPPVHFVVCRDKNSNDYSHWMYVSKEAALENYGLRSAEENWSDVYLFLEPNVSRQMQTQKLDGWYEDAYGYWRKVGNVDIID